MRDEPRKYVTFLPDLRIFSRTVTYSCHTLNKTIADSFGIVDICVQKKNANCDEPGITEPGITDRDPAGLTLFGGSSAGLILLLYRRQVNKHLA